MTRSKLLEYSRKYRETLLGMGSKNEKESGKAYSDDLMSAGEMLKSVIVFLATRRNGRSQNANASIGKRIFLLQIYNQGFNETESLISQGQYFKGTVCLKQEVELLASIRATKRGEDFSGKVPPLANAPQKMGRLYGILNDIGHVSQEGFYRELLEMDGSAVTPTPKVVPMYAEEFFQAYLWILLEMTRESISLFRAMYPKDEGAFLEVMPHFCQVEKILEKHGWTFREQSVTDPNVFQNP